MIVTIGRVSLVFEILLFQQFPDFCGDLAVGLMDAVAKTAVRFQQLPVLGHYSYHPALVQDSAVTAQKSFFFHF